MTIAAPLSTPVCIPMSVLLASKLSELRAEAEVVVPGVVPESENPGRAGSIVAVDDEDEEADDDDDDDDDKDDDDDDFDDIDPGTLEPVETVEDFDEDDFDEDFDDDFEEEWEDEPDDEVSGSELEDEEVDA